jgi:hypothetical protein
MNGEVDFNEYARIEMKFTNFEFYLSRSFTLSLSFPSQN